MDTVVTVVAAAAAAAAAAHTTHVVVIVHDYHCDNATTPRCLLARTSSRSSCVFFIATASGRLLAELEQWSEHWGGNLELGSSLSHRACHGHEGGLIACSGVMVVVVVVAVVAVFIPARRGRLVSHKGRCSKC